ncbi:MAG: hypothetical protein JXR05_11705 [Flavobacteriaceae bacterium]
MNLAKKLKDSGYDLIESPIRNQKLLQLWLKRTFDDIDLYYENVTHPFDSPVELSVSDDPALTVDSTYKVDYKFNIGLSVVGKLLESFGLGMLDLSSKINKGKKISISYDNSVTKEVTTGVLENYFFASDFKYKNPRFIKYLNRDKVIIISGIMLAKNLVVEIETDSAVEAGLEAKLNEIADGKANFTKESDSVLKMKSVGNSYFPIAVKLHRIDFDRGTFDQLRLVSDTRNFFD